jgi:sporulation protein YlmC with PRC-barrel domain
MARRLISAARVQGTQVATRSGNRLGAVMDVMIDKVSGRIAYAVLSYDSIVHLADKLFPVPWDMLQYSTELDAYLVDIPEAKLFMAPGFDEIDTMPDILDAQWTEKLHHFYASAPS